MRPSAKRRRHLIADAAMGDDLITNLSIDLLTCNVDHIPIKDAASTSILLTNWRNIWRSLSVVIISL